MMEYFMRHVVTSLLMFVCIAPHAAASQAAAGKPAIRACSLLTKELVLNVTPRKDTKMSFVVPPMEEAVGASGSACEYGGIGLQINPFTPAGLAEIRKSKTGQAWTAVAGLGDTAYFHENPNGYAELYVSAGAHTLTIQMSVPTGSTAAAIKANTIELAKALIPKLQ
jgi:hypothetical protein